MDVNPFTGIRPFNPDTKMPKPFAVGYTSNAVTTNDKLTGNQAKGFQPFEITPLSTDSTTPPTRQQRLTAAKQHGQKVLKLLQTLTGKSQPAKEDYKRYRAEIRQMPSFNDVNLQRQQYNRDLRTKHTNDE